MDVSTYAIQSLKPHFGERVRRFNVEQHPLPREQYDVIAVYNILEHLQQPHKVAARLFAALRPGGLLIGSVPYNAGVVGRAVTHIGNFFDRTHVSTFTPPVWDRIFRHAGFAPLDLFGEVTIGRNRCRYLRGQAWPHLSFNLMFAWQKEAGR
jgi:SAM-dependent methyltransferase